VCVRRGGGHKKQRERERADRVEVDFNEAVIAAVGIGRQQRLVKLVSRRRNL